MENPNDKVTALERVTAGERGVQMTTLADMRSVSQIIFQSKLAPESFKSAEAIFVGLQAGAEMGLKPMQSLNSIYVIKGRPTLWGDAALALVRNSKLMESIDEYFEFDGKRLAEKDMQYASLKEVPDGLMAVCSTKRIGDTDLKTRYFSVADAKLAGLWGKQTWTTHFKRMLKYKARAFNLRDTFPDVLFGMHIAEEMMGEEPLPAPQCDTPTRENRRKKVDSVTVQPIISPPSEPSGTPEANSEQTDMGAALCPPLSPSSETAPVPSAIIDQEVSRPEAEESREGAANTTGAAPFPTEGITDYNDLTQAFKALGGKDWQFIEFVAFVLCRDEAECEPDKLNQDDIKRIKIHMEQQGIQY